MTLWMTLCDERFSASEIEQPVHLVGLLGMRDINYCGMQVAPGLFKTRGPARPSGPDRAAPSL